MVEKPQLATDDAAELLRELAEEIERHAPGDSAILCSPDDAEAIRWALSVIKAYYETNEHHQAR